MGGRDAARESREPDELRLGGGLQHHHGHHTPLYATPQQQVSTDYGVRYLDSVGVDPGKIVIGAAFYARVFGGVAAAKTVCTEPASSRKPLITRISAIACRWRRASLPTGDAAAQAPYAYNARRQEFATFDDKKSIALKTKYVRDKKLGGIMFWELTCDQPRQGLLDAMYQAAR
ncbi:MAG: glycoside hydrolase family 18 protein [Hymenobacter sp.]